MWSRVVRRWRRAEWAWFERRGEEEGKMERREVQSVGDFIEEIRRRLKEVSFSKYSRVRRLCCVETIVTKMSWCRLVILVKRSVMWDIGRSPVRSGHSSESASKKRI